VSLRRCVTIPALPRREAPSAISRPAFHGFYDGHTVTYLSTDVSSRPQAAEMHINYSAKIGTVKGSPEIYLVKVGR
jgi:hypothetical protein